MGVPSIPLLSHAYEQPSAFTPDHLIASVRSSRGLDETPVPPLCVLEFDGDLTDWLVASKHASRFEGWPCFHTPMFALDLHGVRCGVIPRTIGGPCAVLVAEQLAAAGARLIVGLTSAGRVSAELPVPSVVVATSAVRDEGTSLHYLPPGEVVVAPRGPAVRLERELRSSGRPVFAGRVWTTDAPYRETRAQLEHWQSQGVLAVEMQAASLFAFGAARRVPVACVLTVSNAVDHEGEQFDTGTEEDGVRILEACARAFVRL